jgi:ribonuclease P protein component
MRARPLAAAPLPRLKASADFERVLGVRSRSATPHFAVHHLAALPTAPKSLPGRPLPVRLSTNGDSPRTLPVDDLLADDLAGRHFWIGAVVPKRHARRAVTRSLLKRQIYAAAERHRDRLAPGLWIVRLRSPFDRARFPSATSPALRLSVRSELDALLADAAAVGDRSALMRRG